MPERRLQAQYDHHLWRGGDSSGGHIELTTEITGGLRPMVGRKVDVPLSRWELVDMLAFLCENDSTGATADMIAEKLGGTPRHEFERGDAGSAWKPLCKVCGHEAKHGLHNT